MRGAAAWFWCGLGLAACSASAGTHHLVPTNSGASSPFTSWETAGTSLVEVINAAVADASRPRIIWVTNGVYTLTNSPAYISTDLLITSVNGRDSVIINGDGQWRCFELRHPACVLDSLTISNGYTTNGGGGIVLRNGMVTNCLITHCANEVGTDLSTGGGIRIAGGESNVLANSVIRRNRNWSGGAGGLYVVHATTSAIHHCIFEENMARSGAGMSVGYTLPLAATIRNCLFARNATTNAGGYGGGIYLGNQCARVLIANCTVVSNYAYEGGGGISFQGNYDLTNTVINCLVVSNLDRSAGGRTCNLRFVSGTATFSNAVAYSCSWPSNDVFRVNDGRGNTTNPVQFLAFSEQDYRCDSQSACVNAGTNEAWMADAVDLQGRRRIDPFSRRVDIGGYEYLPKGNLLQMR